MLKWTYLKYFEIFKMAAFLRSRRSFKPEVVPELWYYIEIGHADPYIFSFWSTLQLNNWRNYDDRQTFSTREPSAIPLGTAVDSCLLEPSRRLPSTRATNSAVWLALGAHPNMAGNQCLFRWVNVCHHFEWVGICVRNLIEFNKTNHENSTWFMKALLFSLTIINLALF